MAFKSKMNLDNESTILWFYVYQISFEFYKFAVHEMNDEICLRTYTLF